ncbi:hypothetical protein LZ683_10320 [Comamonas testosteroni]|uniref:hypothetical protein n=1 Tax=Comamonas testosteroni TaxID=285 RepID=UPI0023AB4E6D|nr:hypothetical protein [Comamonas testosteroni]WEE79719.1 hypothetical protein LZ683_10320 [Comamonas testosteroni]
MKTAFGEAVGDVGPRPYKYVSEDGLKLAVGKDSMTGFAGHVGIASSLINLYWYSRALGNDARIAIRNALASVTPTEDDADVLFAFYENGSPCLLHVNTACASCNDVEGLIQLGSELPSGQHRWTSYFADSFLKILNQRGQHPRQTEIIFSQLVALLQSYGANEYLLPYGVGGAFVAAWVTPSGARWQGDHLYVMHGERPEMEDPACATLVRNDVLCLVNNQSKSTKAIPLRCQNESDSDVMARSEASAESAEEIWDSATFDYFISINTSKHIVTVVEMCRNQHHLLLSLHAPQMAERLGVVWTELFREIVNKIDGADVEDPEFMCVKFLPFIEIPIAIQEARDQFAWEQFIDWTADC